jgi:bifunctional isochorismate lyase/aryl carrier protein
MALPKIEPYSMPLAAELPDNKVSWQLEPPRAALLVHDMQGYFVNAFSRTASPAVELVENVRRLIERARQLGMPIYYSAQPGDQTPESRALLGDFWGPGLSRAERDEAIVTELAMREGPLETRLVKHRYSAFQRTELLESLRGRGRNQLVICGVYAHLGCLLTAAEAFMSDVQPFFVADAVADFTPELHAMSLRYVSSRCGVVLPTEHLVTSGVSVLDGLRTEVLALLDEDSGESLDADESLLDRGLDSMRLMTLVERFQRRGAPVTFGDLAEQPTLSAWASLLGQTR